MDGYGALAFVQALVVAVAILLGVAVASTFHYAEVTELRAALISHNLGEYYSDEPGAAPDKFRLIEDNQEQQ